MPITNDAKGIAAILLVAGAITTFVYWKHDSQSKTPRPLDEVIMHTVKIPKVCNSEMYLGLAYSGHFGDSQPLVYCKNAQGENLVCDNSGQIVDGKYYPQFNCYKLEQGGK